MDQPIFSERQSDKQAVIYLRVSTEEQVDNYSLETQEEICKKEVERRGLGIAQVFREEGRSAKSIQGRPALIELLEYCRKHKRQIEAVIVYRLDRISRQTADYLAIRKRLAECEIKLVSATEPTGNSPTEKFVETMLAGFAQMDNDVRSERSKNGLRARVMTGLTNGYVPLGYVSRDGYPTKDPGAFDKLQAGWELMATGTKSLRQMAVILNGQGLRGGKAPRTYLLRPQNLSRIFRNRFYMGKVVSQKYGQEVQGQHPPMVTEELFYRVQAVLDGRNTNLAPTPIKRNRDNPNFPLRRIVKCAKCGTSFTGGSSKGKRQYYGYYFCRNRCSGSNTAAPVLEQATLDELEKYILTESAIDLFSAFARRRYYERVATLQKRREQADAELKKLYEFRQALIEKNIAGVYSDEIFREQNQAVEEKIKTVQLTKNDEMIQRYNLEAITKFLKAKLENLPQTYLESSLEQKRVLLCSIFPSGLQWSENRYSNTQISPFLSAMLDLNKESVSFGSPAGSWTPFLRLKI